MSSNNSGGQQGARTDKIICWVHFKQSQYLKELGALQATLKGTVTKMEKKCGSRAPKIGSSNTN